MNKEEALKTIRASAERLDKAKTVSAEQQELILQTLLTILSVLTKTL